MNETPMIIGGRKVRARNYFAVNNPATSEIVALAPNASPEDLQSAVSAAQNAYRSWSQQSDSQLVEACISVSRKIESHSEELAKLVTLEQGKPLNGMGSRWEVGAAQVWAQSTAMLSLSPEVIQQDDKGRIELTRKPLGVVGSITPWNFPLMIAVWHVLPALRTGNTVVMKPSPNTPLATLRLAELMNEVLPPGVVNCVCGDDKSLNIGASMATDATIRKIAFTGSCGTGQKIMQSAAHTMKRLTLELGGNDAAIVLADVDPEEVAENIFWGAFINNGQTCAAIKRLYVHDRVHDAICDRLARLAHDVPVGNGMDEASLLGPVQNRLQFEKVSSLVEAAKQSGTLLAGGAPGQGLFYPPTVIAGLKDGDALVDQEQFGPALPIVRFTDEDAALAAANRSQNGLGGSVWSRDLDHAKSLARRMECGSVWINKHGALHPNAPFGGTKASGLGVEFGRDGLLEYTDAQVVFS